MEHRLVRYLPLGIRRNGIARVLIRSHVGHVTARYLDPNPVPCQKSVSDVKKLDPEDLGLVRGE